MRFYKDIFRRGRLAFTLIELLVVIGIIAILAGMILVGVQSVKARGMIVRAKYEINTMAAAITQYTADYGIPPVSQTVWKVSADNSRTNDFSYGTNVGGNVDVLAGTYGNPSYRTNNSEVLAVLRNGGPTKLLNDLAQILNPKKKTYIDAPVAANNNSGGLGPDGLFRDPWGMPYIISIDLDSSGTTMDGFYGRFVQSKVRPSSATNAANYSFEITGSVLVWSFGPDSQADPNPDFTTQDGIKAVQGGAEAMLKFGKNKDNILSWDK